MKIVAIINRKQEEQQQQEQQEDSREFIINPSLEQEHHEHFNMKEKDDQFLHLEQLIEAKKNFLLKNQHKLKKISKQNDFLDGIKSDYFNYNNYIVKQKKDQMRALDLLNEYIKELSDSGELSKQNIKDSKHEQKKILREIKAIKHSLDEVIEEDVPENNSENMKTYIHANEK